MTGTVSCDGPHHGVADEVGEAHLAAARAAQVAVDDLAVDLEQLGRDAPEARGRGDARGSPPCWPRCGPPHRGSARLRAPRLAASAGSEAAAGAARGTGRGRRRRSASPLAGAGAGAGVRGWLAAACGAASRCSRRRSPASSRSPRRGRRGTARASRRRARRWDRARSEARGGDEVVSHRCRSYPWRASTPRPAVKRYIESHPARR